MIEGCEGSMSEDERMEEEYSIRLEKEEEEFLDKMMDEIREEEENMEVDENKVEKMEGEGNSIDSIVEGYIADAEFEKNAYMSMMEDGGTVLLLTHERVMQDVTSRGYFMSFMSMKTSFVTSVSIMELISAIDALRMKISFNKQNFLDAKTNGYELDKRTTVNLIDNTRILQHIHDQFLNVLLEGQAQFYRDLEKSKENNGGGENNGEENGKNGCGHIFSDAEISAGMKAREEKKDDN